MRDWVSDRLLYDNFVLKSESMSYMHLLRIIIDMNGDLGEAHLQKRFPKIDH